MLYEVITEIKGMVVARQAMGSWQEEFEKRKDPAGKTYYWLTGNFINHEPDAKDTDEWAIQNGYVSVVPVTTDMTAYRITSYNVCYTKLLRRSK